MPLTRNAVAFAFCPTGRSSSSTTATFESNGASMVGVSTPCVGQCRVTRLAQRVDRRRLDDSLDAPRQLRVERDVGIRLQLRERDVFGVVGRGPAQLIRDVP